MKFRARVLETGRFGDVTYGFEGHKGLEVQGVNQLGCKKQSFWQLSYIMLWLSAKTTLNLFIRTLHLDNAP